MTPEFIGRAVHVTTHGDVRVPAFFRLDDSEYIVAEILESWPDYSFGRSPSRRRKWWQRRHRNYYRVKTADGNVFELYYDRGTSLSHPERKKWFLTRKL